MLKQITAFAAILASVSIAPAQSIMMVSVGATLEKTIDTKKAKAGDPISAKVSTAAQLNDGTKVPAGSVLSGYIDSVTPSEKKSDSSMTVTFDKLQIKNGSEISVKVTLVSAMSTAPTGDDRPYDPSSYRPGTLGDNKANGQNSQGTGSTATPHPIEGLTVTGSPNDVSSGTLKQAKGNVHLTSGVNLVFSVAIVPAGGKVQ